MKNVTPAMKMVDQINIKDWDDVHDPDLDRQVNGVTNAITIQDLVHQMTEELDEVQAVIEHFHLGITINDVRDPDPDQHRVKPDIEITNAKLILWWKLL